MHRILATCLALVLGFATAKAMPGTAFAPADSSTLILDKRTEIPGETLKPGTYSIQVLDHLSDRVVIRMEDEKGKTHTVFLAVPSTSLSSHPVVGGSITWQYQLNGNTALRGFRFPSGYTVEFVYPKSEAAQLAKLNQGSVLAVDPDSEQRPALRHMSTEDLQMVHLWMLSLTAVGPNDKTHAILARAYQPPSNPEPVRVATNSVAPIPPSKLNERTAPERSAPRAILSTPRPRPVIATLPHTASYLPLLLLTTFGALVAAIILHFCLLTGRLRKAE